MSREGWAQWNSSDGFGRGAALVGVRGSGILKASHSQDAHPMPKQDLSDRLEKFLFDARELSILSGAQRREAQERLDADYLDLYRLFRKLSKKEASVVARQATDEATKALVDHLLLGQGRIRDIHKPIARLIEEDPARTDWAISEFMTTQDAYLLIQKGRSPKTRKESEIDLDERTRRLLIVMLGAGAGLPLRTLLT